VIQADTGVSLGNSATPTNEAVVVRDAADTIIDEVNYETALDGWPGNNNQASIYLKPGAISQLANDLGSNWALSNVGVDGAFQAQALNPDIANATLMDMPRRGRSSWTPCPSQARWQSWGWPGSPHCEQGDGEFESHD
jgi:hypothetical protein